MTGLSLGLTLGLGGGAGFSPGSLGSSLVRWWDASDVSTLTLDGSSVTTWASKVGGFSAGNTANKPTWSATAVNGRPGVSADGTQILIMDSLDGVPLGANPCTMLLVGQLGLVGFFPPMLAYGVAGATDQTRAIDGFADSGNVGASIWGTGHDTGVSMLLTPRVIIAQFLDATNRIVTVDGVDYAFTGGSMNTVAGEGRMFTTPTSSAGNAVGTIQEAGIINRALTTAEIAGLTGYLSRKWGL